MPLGTQTQTGVKPLTATHIMNIFQYAASEEKYFEAVLDSMGGGYKRLTTFFSDLSIAEVYGLSAIKSTFDEVCESWINDYKYFTEFVMCLNYKSWEMAERGDNEKGQLYSDLYYKGVDLFYEKYADNEEAKDYYFRIMD